MQEKHVNSFFQYPKCFAYAMHLNDQPLSLAEHIDSDNEEKQWRVNEGEASSFRPEHNPNKPHAIYKHLASVRSQTRAVLLHVSSGNSGELQKEQNAL